VKENRKKRNSGKDGKGKLIVHHRTRLYKEKGRVKKDRRRKKKP